MEAAAKPIVNFRICKHYFGSLLSKIIIIVSKL